MKNKYHVFLSYRRRDECNGRWMTRVRDELRHRGLQVWTDEFLVIGTPTWSREIDQAIRRSHCVVVLLSPSALRSRFVEQEIALAQACKKPVYFLLVRDELIVGDFDETTIYVDTPLTCPPCIPITTSELFEKAINQLEQTVKGVRIHQSSNRKREIDEEFFDVFIIYRPKNHREVQEIGGALIDCGLRVNWAEPHQLDEMHLNFRGLPSWHDVIVKWIHNSTCVILLLSPDMVQSTWVMREISTAFAARKPIFPLSTVEQLDDVARFGIQDYQTKHFILPAASSITDEDVKKLNETWFELFSAICMRLGINPYNTIEQANQRRERINQLVGKLPQIAPLNPFSWVMLVWRMSVKKDEFIAYSHKFGYEKTFLWFATFITWLVFFIPLFGLWVGNLQHATMSPDLLRDKPLWIITVTILVALPTVYWREQKLAHRHVQYDALLLSLIYLILSSVIVLTVEDAFIFFLFAISLVATMSNISRVIGSQTLTRSLKGALGVIVVLITILNTNYTVTLINSQTSIYISDWGALALGSVLLIYTWVFIEIYCFSQSRRYHVAVTPGRYSKNSKHWGLLLILTSCFVGLIYLFGVGEIKTISPLVSEFLENLAETVILWYRSQGG